MTNTPTTPPEVVEQWQLQFRTWFEDKYLCTIEPDGTGWIAPRMAGLGGRSQGKSVALCANVAWAAWAESRRTECIELPEPIEFDDGHDEPSRHYWPTQIKAALKSQGYQCRVKG